MEEKPKTNRSDRRILGFSLSPELAREVKAEAERRGISLRTLFEELWAMHKQNSRVSDEGNHERD
jgi:hypothetical protein